MKHTDMERILDMCLAMTSERDREALLSSILDAAMDISNCDAGTLYLLEDDGLHFCRMVTRSQGVRQGGHADPITLPPVPLEEKYVCSWAALHNQNINVADVRTDTHFDFTGSMRYDEMTGYRTKSMLVVPMRNDRGELIGVTQLINALDDEGETIPFDPEIEMLVCAIASQAAISITNMQYAEQITVLLDSLVGALSKAIDERSHYNANHTKNMVAYGENFLNWLERTGNPWKFDPDKRRTFLMSVWLHDVGKLVVPLEVMDKESRLGPGIRVVRERLRVIGLLDRIAALEGRIDEAELEKREAEREDTLAFIERINRAGFLPDPDLERVKALAGRVYTDENGQITPLLTDQEADCLCIRKGTLTDEEREIMQRDEGRGHVARRRQGAAVRTGHHHPRGQTRPRHPDAALLVRAAARRGAAPDDPGCVRRADRQGPSVQARDTPEQGAGHSPQHGGGGRRGRRDPRAVRGEQTLGRHSARRSITTWEEPAMKRVLSIVLTLVLTLSLAASALADTAKGTTLRLASFNGTVSMTNASGKSVTPKADLRLYNGYGVETGAKSDAYISLDSSKAVKLDAGTSVTVIVMNQFLLPYRVCKQFAHNA